MVPGNVMLICIPPDPFGRMEMMGRMLGFSIRAVAINVCGRQKVNTSKHEHEYQKSFDMKMVL